MILGGHEHENMQLWRGAASVPIFKADANARAVYIHRLVYDTGRRALTVRSILRRVTAEIPEDPATLAAIRHWQELGFAAFRAEGFEPEQLVATVPIALDGLEASVRNRPTELTRLIAESLLAAVPEAELALFNSGSIRIDDLIPPGPLSEFDIIRILPFGGLVCRAEIDGALLHRVLDQGLANRGQGGFLQGAGVTKDDGGWLVNGASLEESRPYRMATSDFLVSGREQGLEFLSDKNPGLRVFCREDSDVRFAFRDYLRRTYDAP
jgi:5'-nucleotidase / UDP-sugar diphosphatase